MFFSLVFGSCSSFSFLGFFGLMFQAFGLSSFGPWGEWLIFSRLLKQIQVLLAGVQRALVGCVEQDVGDAGW